MVLMPSIVLYQAEIYIEFFCSVCNVLARVINFVLRSQVVEECLELERPSVYTWIWHMCWPWH